MAESLSLCVNTLTAISFAAESCQILYSFFSSVKKAPEEVQHLVDELSALCTTFIDIEALAKIIPGPADLSPEFMDRLHSCLDDLRELQAVVSDISEKLKGGRIRKTWTRLGWPLAEKPIIKILRNIRSYRTTFALTLSTLQM
jgi:hypothetical protein